MSLPILGTPRILRKTADAFKMCYSHNQFKRFKQYLTGLLTGGKTPTISSIARLLTDPVDQSSLNRFLTTYAWDGTKLNRPSDLKLFKPQNLSLLINLKGIQMQTNLKSWRTTSTRIACLFLTMSLVFVPVLTTPLPTPLIITFGDSNAVHTAENTLDARVSAISIQYSNPLKALYVIRARTLIIIGHGAAGAACGTADTSTNKLVTWNTVKPLVQGTPAMHNYILACYSARIAAKLRGMGRHATGFKGPIDAEIAALSTVLSITKRMGASNLYQKTLMTTIRTIFNKLTGIEEINPLFWMKGEVIKGWLGIPYRWQIWWKFTKPEANQLYHTLVTYALPLSQIATILAGLADPLVGILLEIFLVIQIGTLATTFREAQGYSDGKLVTFLDYWAMYGIWKVRWLKKDKTKVASPIPSYRLGDAQSVAVGLPSDWTWVMTFPGSDDDSDDSDDSGGGGGSRYLKQEGY